MQNETLKQIDSNIIRQHADEFTSKPPKYDLPTIKFLAKKDNTFFVVSILNRHTMNYPSKAELTNNYPIDVVIYNLKSNESIIMNIEDFIKEFSLNEQNKQELIEKDDKNLDIKELINIFGEIISNKDEIDIDKYNDLYYPNIVNYLSKFEVYKKYLSIFSLSNFNNENDNNEFFKIKCHFCGNEISVNKNVPNNIKTLDLMCPNCKAFIKYGNQNYSDDVDDIKSAEKAQELLKKIAYNIFAKKDSLESSKNQLLNFVKSSSSYDNKWPKCYNFKDAIDYLLFLQINKLDRKDLNWIKTPFQTAYNYLAYIYNELGNYEEALKMTDVALRWNPMNLSALFERCETFIKQNKWEDFKALTDSLYDKIYDSHSLAHYYRNLGLYYFKQNNLEIAYAAYRASVVFEKNSKAFQKMDNIKEKLSKQNYDMPADVGIKLLKNHNIIFGPKKENLDMLRELYLNEKSLLKEFDAENQLKKRIYYLTGDEKFEILTKLVDEKTGFSISIPEIWESIGNQERNTSFESNNIFTIRTSDKTLIFVNNEGNCTIEQFDAIYKSKLQSIINSNNAKLIDSRTLTLRYLSGPKDFKVAIFDIFNDDKMHRIIHIFYLLNNVLIDFSTSIDEKIDNNDEKRFFNQANMLNMMKILLSIVELKSEDVTYNKKVERNPFTKPEQK